MSFIGLAITANAQSIFADQQTNSTTATCLVCSVADPDLAVDGDETTASTLTANLGLLGGAVEQTLIFPVTGAVGDTVEILLEGSEALLDISLLGNVSVQSTLGGVANGDLKDAGITSVSVLGARKFLFKFKPGNTYDGVSVILNTGVLGLTSTLNVYYARIFKENSTSGLTSCTTPDNVNSTVNCPLLGTLLPLCSVDNAVAVITQDPTDFATINLAADLGATGSIGAGYNTPTCSTDSVSIIIERPGSAISANLLGSSISFSTYLNGAENSNTVLLVENLNVVSGASIYEYKFGPGVVFDSVSVNLETGLLGALTTLRVYNICIQRKLAPTPDPVLGSSTRACFEGDLTINFQVPAGDNIRVYSERTRTTAPVYTGPSPFVATNLTMDTTFYVETFSLSGCASQGIDSIFIDVLEPVQPAITEDIIACFNAPARIAPLPGGSIFAFYTDTNAAPVFTGGAFITGPIISDTTFFVKNTIDNFCFEDFFQTQTITLFEEPQIANTVDTIGICEGGVDPIPVFVTNEAVTGVTITYSVYNRDTILLATFNFPDTAFIPRSEINATIAGDIDTLIVDATSGTCRESANKQTLIVKIVDPNSVETPQVDTTIVCNTDSAVVRINTTLRGFRYDWYTDSIGGTIAYTGDSIFVSGLTDTLRLYVESSFGACASASRGEAVIIPLSATNNNFTDLDRNICIGDSTLLIAMNDAGFDVVWYDAAIAGNIIVNNDSLQTTVLPSDTTFYIEAQGLNCASPSRFPVRVTRSAPPTIDVDKDQYYVCSGDDVALIANPSAGSTGVTWWTLPAGGTLVSTDNPFNFDSTPIGANASFQFYAQADNDMCPSDARAMVTVSNVDGSAQPLISATTPICKGDNAMLVASSPNVVGVTYTWWTAATGGTLLAQSDIYNTGEIQNDVTIYAKIEFGDSVCLNAGRRAQLIETLPVLDAPANVRCTNTEGNSVSFAWDAVTGANEYEYDFTIEDGATGTLRTTATTLDFNGLANGTTVTILVRAIGDLDCQTSDPGYASCTAGCPINNSKLNQFEYVICQNEQIEIIINLDPNLDPSVVSGIQIGIVGQPGTSQNLRYIYPDDFANTPDLSSPLAGTVVDSIEFYISYPGIEGCDSLVLPTRVVINPIPDIDPTNAITVVPLVPPVVGQIVDEYQFISNVPGGFDLLWDFGDGTTSNELNPIHKFAVRDTPYRVTLTVTNQLGCGSTVAYFRDIIVTTVPDIFIPNTFTPNNDGKNDGFRIFGEGISLDNFTIFNIYGNIVFETEELSESWDGNFNGKAAQGGTYYYTAVIRDFLGLTYEKEGSFTLIRK